MSKPTTPAPAQTPRPAMPAAAQTPAPAAPPAAQTSAPASPDAAAREAEKRTAAFNAATAPRSTRVLTPSEDYQQRLTEKAKAGLLCPRNPCRSRRIRVYRTMPTETGSVLRYRECEACGHRFSTEEKPRG